MSPVPSLATFPVSRRRGLAAGLAALAAAAGLSPTARAETPYPSRPVTVVVAFAPGGPNDVMARVLAAKLSSAFGQQFIVDNKPGAGGTIGTAAVAKAAADGHTLLFNSAPFVTAPSLYGSRLSYDTLRDFTGISKVAESPLALMVNPSTAGRNHSSLKGLLAAAKAAPGKINFGSGGVASTSHLAGALLEVTAGVDLQHIPYKGGGQSVIGLMGGELDLLLDSVTAGASFLQSGKLKALAVTGSQRMARMPDVPTFAEAGLPDFRMVHWVGLVAPAKTPPAVLDRLQREVAKALASDDVRARLAELGAEPAPSSRDQFNEFLKAEVTQWARVIKQARIQAD